MAAAKKEMAVAKNLEAPRRGGLRAIGATLPQATRDAIGRRGFVEARLMLDWSAVVGEAMARHTLPEKLSRARGGEAGGSLSVLVDGAFALELQHLAPLVVERVNMYFGYEAVARLKLRQGRVPTAPSRRRPKPAALAPEMARDLAEWLGRIGDPDLRAALDRLGRSVLAPRRRP
ncbi:MAG: DUF721 domain-containing protein [Proteobacteria bacterium]|nr:DUF721 domain-containing protein [Pseudomonadota bacterium]MBI3498296.1 DUF721 domain-containing protein [Pseudomonadota bacterium]